MYRKLLRMNIKYKTLISIIFIEYITFISVLINALMLNSTKEMHPYAFLLLYTFSFFIIMLIILLLILYFFHILNLTISKINLYRIVLFPNIVILIMIVIGIA